MRADVVITNSGAGSDGSPLLIAKPAGGGDEKWSLLHAGLAITRGGCGPDAARTCTTRHCRRPPSRGVIDPAPLGPGAGCCVYACRAKLRHSTTFPGDGAGPSVTRFEQGRSTHGEWETT